MGLYQTLAKLVVPPPAQGWQLTDFAGVDQLHTGGLEASRHLLGWLPTKINRGLDLACGLGGTARMIADIKPCQMLATDISADYINSAHLLHRQIAPPLSCEYLVADSLHLPFVANYFDLLVSQHGMMAIANKMALLKEIARVLTPQGQLLVHEIFISEGCQDTEVSYPTPWANTASNSFLQTWHNWQVQAQAVGFSIDRHVEQTTHALAWLRSTNQLNKKTSSSPIASARFHAKLALGNQAGLMSKNLLHNLQAQKIEVHSARLRL